MERRAVSVQTEAGHVFNAAFTRSRVHAKRLRPTSTRSKT